MVLSQRIQKLMPWDAVYAYVLTAGYIGSLSLEILVGPDLFIGLTGCLMLLLLVSSVVVMVARLGGGARLFPRVLPLILAPMCILLGFSGAPLYCCDLHVMRQIYRAGGPKALNDWGQKWIRDYEPGQKTFDSGGQDKMPSRLREYLGGWFGPFGDPKHIPPILRIEFGGGFFDYGIFVIPSAEAAKRNWWQKLLDWPPEVVVYHDD